MKQIKPKICKIFVSIAILHKSKENTRKCIFLPITINNAQIEGPAPGKFECVILKRNLESQRIPDTGEYQAGDKMTRSSQPREHDTVEQDGLE